MKVRKSLNRWFLLTVSALWTVLSGGAYALAEEATAAHAGGWRPVYDDVMMVVNFCILIFILVRLGKAPLKNFLTAKQDEVAQEIERLEQEKIEAQAEVEETKRLIAEGDQHLQKIRDRIIAEGEHTKNRIIETARTESAFMMEAAKRRVTTQLGEAQATFRAQLIDAAIAIVSRRLPKEISPQDHDHQVDLFFNNLGRAKGTLSSARSASR